MKIYKTLTVVAIASSFFSLNSFSKSATQTIMGLERARDFNNAVHGNIYIQTASFSSKTKAINYQQFLKGKINSTVKIQQKHGFYRVVIGPLQSASQVRMAGQKILGKPVYVKKQYIKPQTNTPNMPKSSSHVSSQSIKIHKQPLMNKTNKLYQGWYIAVDAGGQKTNTDQMTIGNGSSAPAPYNKDIYTTNSNNQAVAGVGIGKRWERDQRWIPFYSMGLKYQHLFSNDIQGQVIQYSDPLYTNYNYNWGLSSNAITASGKFDIIRFKKILPYVSAGAGVAINQTSQYSELALPEITPRISPGFSGQNTSQFTYTFGAGLDFKVTKNLSLSAGYEFQDWGGFNSGGGTVRWATQKLTQNNYQSNKFLFSADYWFNN